MGLARRAAISVVKNGRTYDLKAIAGAAHGYLPDRLPLTAKDFSGGDATVKKKLEDLGFTFANDEPQPLPSPGDVLTNEEIGRRFGVGIMSGMRRNTKRNLLVLISDPFKGLYQDRWEGDVLHYTGMGQTGDQSLTHAQNKTLNESPATKIKVYLLEAMEPLKYTYAGEVELVAIPTPKSSWTIRSNRVRFGCSRFSLNQEAQYRFSPRSKLARSKIVTHERRANSRPRI